MRSDDDFHFEFDDLNLCRHTELMMVELDDVYFIGHLKDDAEGKTWMEGAYCIDEQDDGYSVELIPVPRFQIDLLLQEIIVVGNADQMRLMYDECYLNLGHINDIPMLFNSTRH